MSLVAGDYSSKILSGEINPPVIDLNTNTGINGEKPIIEKVLDQQIVADDMVKRTVTTSEQKLASPAPITTSTKTEHVKKIGLILLVIGLSVAAFLFANKKYPTATKWVVGIAVALFALIVGWFWLFFAWGGENNYEKYFAKYFGKTQRQKDIEQGKIDLQKSYEARKMKFEKPCQDEGGQWTTDKLGNPGCYKSDGTFIDIEDPFRNM